MWVVRLWHQYLGKLRMLLYSEKFAAGVSTRWWEQSPGCIDSIAYDNPNIYSRIHGRKTKEWSGPVHSFCGGSVAAGSAPVRRSRAWGEEVMTGARTSSVGSLRFLFFQWRRDQLFPPVAPSSHSFFVVEASFLGSWGKAVKNKSTPKLDSVGGLNRRGHCRLI